MSSPQGNAIVEEKNKQIKQMTDMAYSALVINREKRKLPEDVFVHHFLPYFSGKGNSNPDRNPVAEWIGVAGTAMSEVDIVDNKGEVLFTVPALFETNMLSVAKQNAQDNMGGIISNYELHAARTPAEGQRYLNNAIDRKVDALVQSHDLSPVQQRWVSIMDRYQIPRPAALSTSVKKQDVDPGDDLEY